MTGDERAKRITAWAWAATILGVEAGPDRLIGLVETTAEIPFASLKPALELVIKTDPAGFLPSPGSVISAAKRLAERASMDRPRLAAGEMTREQRERWEADVNPECWDVETWCEFIRLMKTDVVFSSRVNRVKGERHRWIDEQMVAEIGRRRASASYRIQLRRQLLRESFAYFPRPNPWELNRRGSEASV